MNYDGVTTKGRRELKGLFLVLVEGKLGSWALAEYHPPIMPHSTRTQGRGKQETSGVPANGRCVTSGKW